MNMGKQNNIAVWAELIELCLNVLAQLTQTAETRLLNFWTYRGGGKTTFLHRLKAALDLPDVALAGLWDVAVSDVEHIIQEVLRALEASSQKRKVVFLDNIDHLLRMKNGEDFFEFEQRLVFPLLERTDVLLITISRFSTLPWREYDVRICQENHPIRALNRQEMIQLAELWSLDAQRLFELSLGYLQVLSWLQQEPYPSEKALAQRITDYFLADLPPAERELATVAALLPAFDVAVLRRISPKAGQESEEGLYAAYIEHIRGLLAAGLTAWNMNVGAYYMTNSTVRRLLARSYKILHREDFARIHEMAMEYYQAEARHAGYLHRTLVSALYHTACARSTQAGTNVGEFCERWVQDSIPRWDGADWPAVLQAWESGAGDITLREELEVLLGVEVIAEITQLLAKAQYAMEVAQ